MDEKKRNIYKACTFVGIESLLIYLILTVGGTYVMLLILRILFAGIATIAFAIKLGVQLTSDESWGRSVFLIGICLSVIVMTAVLLV